MRGERNRKQINKRTGTPPVYLLLVPHTGPSSLRLQPARSHARVLREIENSIESVAHSLKNDAWHAFLTLSTAWPITLQPSYNPWNAVPPPLSCVQRTLKWQNCGGGISAGSQPYGLGLVQWSWTSESLDHIRQLANQKMGNLLHKANGQNEKNWPGLVSRDFWILMNQKWWPAPHLCLPWWEACSQGETGSGDDPPPIQEGAVPPWPGSFRITMNFIVFRTMLDARIRVRVWELC